MNNLKHSQVKQSVSVSSCRCYKRTCRRSSSFTNIQGTLGNFLPFFVLVDVQQLSKSFCYIIAGICMQPTFKSNKQFCMSLQVTAAPVELSEAASPSAYGS